MKVSLTAEALHDLERIADYLAEESPEAARQLVRNLTSKAREIGDRPKAWPVVHTVRTFAVRRRVVGSYLIFYVVGAVVSIVRVLHGAQEHESILFDNDEPRAEH